MEKNKFKTVKGRVTVYGLACGHIELFKLEGNRLKLWHEGACYHVLHAADDSGRIFWDSFDKVSDARKRFDRAKREIKLILSYGKAPK